MFATGGECVMNTEPDIIADGYEWSDQERSVRRFDRMRREQLPTAARDMELEWREHIFDIASLLKIANRKVTTWLFWTLCLNLLLAEFIRYCAANIQFAVLYPCASFICGLIAYYCFSVTTSGAKALAAFFVPQAVFIFLEMCFSPILNRYFVLLPIVGALFVLGWLVDQINTHYVRWITADLVLSRERILRLRTLWDMRFKVFQLSSEIERLRNVVRDLEDESKEEEAQEAWEEMQYVREVRLYPVSFFFLAILGSLFLLGLSSTGLVLSCLCLAICFVFLGRPIKVDSVGYALWTSVCAYASWLAWDPEQDWVNSPGYFNDRLVGPFDRGLLTMGAFALVSIAFVPPLPFWTWGNFVQCLWIAQYSFFLHVLLPALLLVLTLLAIGARPMVMFLFAVERMEDGEEEEE
jgi:hypothetical protein